MEKLRSRYWLFKTDPETYSYDTLAKKKGGDVWDGVKNPLALQHLREVRKGDRVLIYHTGSEKAVVGMARVTRSAHSDPAACDPKLVVVDLVAVGRLSRPLPLAELKGDPLYDDFDLIRIGRLSVMPVDERLWKAMIRRADSASRATSESE